MGFDGFDSILFAYEQIPKKGKTELLPVMVWIAGGGFSSGHGGLSLYGPHYFLDKDVVVVSFNYRVGILGIPTRFVRHLIQRAIEYNRI